jgi:cytochrome c oxidase subunit I+III
VWQSRPGLIGWIAEVNNRPLGIRYMIASLTFFFIGMVLAMVMRTQLAVARQSICMGPDSYNQVFTMHGSTMLYLFAVPFIEGLGSICSAADRSAGRGFSPLTNFGYWLYLFGG